MIAVLDAALLSAVDVAQIEAEWILLTLQCNCGGSAVFRLLVVAAIRILGSLLRLIRGNIRGKRNGNSETDVISIDIRPSNLE